MPKTSQVLTSPLEGTVVAPTYNYIDEQQAQIKALREVRGVRSGMTGTILMILESQHAATLQLHEDDPYYPWELRFLDRPDTMPRYMRAAKWYILFLPKPRDSSQYSLLFKEIRRCEETHREDHGVEAGI